MDADEYIKFVSFDSNGNKRSFKLRSQEITEQKLSLFSAIDANRMVIKHPDDGRKVKIEELSVIFDPYEVALEELEFENTWVRICSLKEFEDKIDKSKTNMKAIRLPIHGRDVLVLKKDDTFYAIGK